MSKQDDEATTRRPAALAVGDTIRVASIASSPPLVRVGEQPSLPPGQQADRYEVRQRLGMGGMGEVLLCKDRRIGREVAFKVIRGEEEQRRDSVARFEREARVQGQLEHPSVVPVYDLGVEASGRSYFTMKRVRGKTLADCIQELRQNAAEGGLSRRRLLNAFSQLCMAVAFAHSRGVLHRDIKPENVMLGDFGEVHLLDWGIATVQDDLRASLEEGQKEVVDATLDEQHKTLVGDMIGTPGYMSPEQIQGDPDRIDERADVFALGAVLFELLTYEPLVEGATVDQLLRSTLAGVDARARARAPERDVPPELEDVCVRATAALEDRYPSARALRDDVERYLDGDRDLLRRKELAAERVGRAEQAAAGAHADAASADALRGAALKELAAAVALDPGNARGLELLGQLLLKGPSQMPADASRALEAQRKSRRRGLRMMMLKVSLVFPLGSALIATLGVRSAPMFLMLLAASLLVPTLAFISVRADDDRVTPVLLAAAAMLSASAGSLVVGPLINVPCMVLAVCVVFAALSATRVRVLAIPMAVAAVAVPFLLQVTGVLPRSYLFENGQLRVLPLVTHLPEGGTLMFMVTTSLLTIVLTALVVLRLRRMLEFLEERLFMQAWTLRGLVPEGARYEPARVSEPPSLLGGAP